MSSVQELLLAAQSKAKRSPIAPLLDLLDAGVAGYQTGQQIAETGAKTNLTRSETIKNLILQQQAQQEIDNQIAMMNDPNNPLRQQIQEQVGTQSEQNLRNGQASIAPKPTIPTPAGKFETTWSQDEKGRISRTIKEVPPKPPEVPKTLDEIIASRVNSGEIPLDQALAMKNQPIVDRASEIQTMKDQAKLQREKPKAEGALNNTLREYDNMINEANAIKNDPSLPQATGLFAPLSHISGTGAKRVSARLETLKAKTLLNVLSSLKQLSTTGASGFGQLSNVEGETIKNSVSTLDRTQNTQDFKDSIDRFITEMKARKEGLASTFSDTYGGSPTTTTNPPPSSEQIPTVTTQQQYDALPPGSTYIDSQGTKATKAGKR